MSGRKDRLAEQLSRMGALRVMELLPGRPQLLVVNYHRIGRRQDTSLDREVFSTDAEGLEAQVRIIQRTCDLLHPLEAFDIITRGRPLRRPSALLTFDDGYLDNYRLALPVLEACKASAVFYLVTGYLDDPHQVPWWDRIAWLVRQCEGGTVTLERPARRSWQVEADNVDSVIAEVMAIYRNAVSDSAGEAAFIAELEACAGTREVAGIGRLFMTWEEARDMQARGMVIGLHTHSHHILSRLDEEGQRYELGHSKTLMAARLGASCDTLAYPVGSPGTYTAATKRIARELGYRCALAFGGSVAKRGGTNLPGEIDPFEVKRVCLPSYATTARSRTAVSLMSLTRQVWY